MGTGNVATNLAAGLSRAGHTAKLGSRNPARANVPPMRNVSVGTLREAATFGDVVIVAVPFTAVKETVDAIGPSNLEGKILVDATNNLTPSYEWAIGFTSSGAEELAKLAHGAKVVKAFNTVFAQNMSRGLLAGHRLLALVAADDADAKRTVMDLAFDIGFHPVDAGALRCARFLEPMGLQLIELGYNRKMSTAIGWALIRERSA